jgi:hypothetical protein
MGPLTGISILSKKSGGADTYCPYRIEALVLPNVQKVVRDGLGRARREEQRQRLLERRKASVQQSRQLGICRCTSAQTSEQFGLAVYSHVIGDSHRDAVEKLASVLGFWDRMDSRQKLERR